MRQDDTESDWKAFDRLRNEAVWDWSDATMVSRAQLRVIASTTWVIVAALAAGMNALWGVPALASAVLSLAHAHRPSVVRIGEELRHRHPLLLGVWRRLFQYPREPHVNPVGVAEVVSLVIIATGTGWLGGAFDSQPIAGLAATLAVVVLLASIASNLLGHVVWELSPGPRLFRIARPLLGPAMAIAAMTLLWPTADDAVSRLVAIGGPVFAALVALRSARSTANHIETIDRLSQSVRYQSDLLFNSLAHSYVKDPARGVLNIIDSIGDSGTRGEIRRLCYRISQLCADTNPLGDGSVQGIAQTVVNSLTSIEPWGRWGACVKADLKAETLEERDRNLVFHAVSDCFTNAAVAQADDLRIDLVAKPEPYGSEILLRVHCRCGEQLGDIRPDSSLMRLAELVAAENGNFIILNGHDSSHTFEISWPTLAAQPRAIGEDSRTADS